MSRMPGLFRRLRRRKHQAEPEPARPKGLGEPPAALADADDAELDTLRGELVRELDRIAAGDDGSAAFRRC
jgi:hypothetical protein